MSYVSICRVIDEDTLRCRRIKTALFDPMIEMRGEDWASVGVHCKAGLWEEEADVKIEDVRGKVVACPWKAGNRKKTVLSTAPFSFIRELK